MFFNVATYNLNLQTLLCSRYITILRVADSSVVFPWRCLLNLNYTRLRSKLLIVKI